MKTFLNQLKWQFVLLQKNKIISISLILTFIYGTLFYFIKDATNIDKSLVFMILNDPSIIGYFFIALAIYTEIKHQILPAIFTTPIKLHHYIISKTIALSVIGLVCSLILAFFVKGLDFDILNFSIGAMSICILTSLLAISILTFASDFLNFAMLSIPIFLIFMTIPLLQYLGLFEIGFAIHIFPIQSSINLLDHGVSETEVNLPLSYLSIIAWISILYLIAYKLFSTKIVHQ